MYLHTLIHTYTYVKPGQLRIVYTVNVERFTGLNIHGFSPMRSFVGNTFVVHWPAVFIIQL